MGSFFILLNKDLLHSNKGVNPECDSRLANLVLKGLNFLNSNTKLKKYLTREQLWGS